VSHAAGRAPVAPPTRLRVSGPADFVAVVPYLVGFHPRESVVALLFRDGRVLVSARVDLPPPGLTRQLSAHLRQVVARHGVEEVVLVGYADDPARGRRVLESLLAAPPTRVRHALLVAAGRWWSLTCRDGCCPGEGSPHDPAGHPLAAEAVLAGLAPVRDRSVLREQVAGPPAREQARLLGRLAPLHDRVRGLGTAGAARLMAVTVRRCLDGADPLQEVDALLLAALAHQLVVRDVAWALMDRRDADDHVRLWGRVVARAPDLFALGPLGLLGAAAWIAGEGALQNCCVERLERLDPGYTLTGVLSDLSEKALPPSTWEDMAEEVRREVCTLTGLERLH